MVSRIDLEESIRKAGESRAKRYEEMTNNIRPHVKEFNGVLYSSAGFGILKACMESDGPRALESDDRENYAQGNLEQTSFFNSCINYFKCHFLNW